MKSILCIVIILFSFNPECYSQRNRVRLNLSKTVPVIDGVIEKSEWKGAKTILMKRVNNRRITVLIKYDMENLYVAFQNLEDLNNIRLQPELIIHTDLENLYWNENCFWFHSSYSNCYGIGVYYYWEDCTTHPRGWKANTFPFKNGHDNIEFKISFSKLNITPVKGRQLRIAFKISDPLKQHIYWPIAAGLDDPGTWGIIKL